MGRCQAVIREVRFVIEGELTHCYVAVDAAGDCPISVQGWHHKAFPASKSAKDILESKDFQDYLLWDLGAPDRRSDRADRYERALVEVNDWCERHAPHEPPHDIARAALAGDSS